MNKNPAIGVISIIALATIAIVISIQPVQSVLGQVVVKAERTLGTTSVPAGERKAPPAITGNNVYSAWWTNETTNNNEEVMFRASTDGGVTFGDKINLSNSTDADSTTVEIDSDADSVVVSWWETNQTDDTPVMRVSNDNGATFGPVLTLATNGTIGSAAADDSS